MTDSLDSLRERIKQAEKPKRGKRKDFTPVEASELAYGSVLAFDQSLTKTGWVQMKNYPKGLRIYRGGVLFPHYERSLKGFEATFAKDISVDSQISRIISGASGQVEAVVHEMPAVMGYRLESSLMAAAAIRRAAAKNWLPVVMVSRQRAYSTFVGSAYAEKSEGTRAVNALFPAHRRETERWTQDVHDAVLLGLTYLYEKKVTQP